MAEPTKRRNGTTPLPEGWEEWPTLTEAAALAGISRKRLSGYIQQGAVKKYLAPNSRGTGLGAYKIDPEELKQLEELLEEESETAAAPTTADVVRASVEGLKTAQSHAERLITLFDGPYKFVLDTMREENASLRAELAAMRSERAANEAQREAMRSQQLIETVALEEVRSAQANKKEAFELAKKLGGYFIKKQMGIDGVDPRLIALHSAVSKIPRESIEVLFKMGILPPDVEADLKTGLDWKDDSTPAEPEKAPT